MANIKIYLPRKLAAPSAFVRDMYVTLDKSSSGLATQLPHDEKVVTIGIGSSPCFCYTYSCKIQVLGVP